MIVCLVLLICTYLYFQVNALEVSRYIIASEKLGEEFSGKRMLHLGDLHGKSFGKDNKRLIRLIDEQKPDVVFLTGDLIDADKKDYSPVYCLLKHLTEHYKTYYIIGNHEQKAPIKKNKKVYERYFKEIKELDLRQMCNERFVLDSEFEIVQEGGINLYGLELPFSSYRYLLSNREAEAIDLEFMEKRLGRLDTNEFNLLLTHNPLYFKEYVKFGADMILAGHVHGGIVRLPFIGGVFSPDRTFFPKYAFGEYKDEKTTMFVTKGLGGSALLMRINCRPEIATIDIK